MTDYDPAADSTNSYYAARKYQREKLLREGTWKHIGPRNDEERAIMPGDRWTLEHVIALINGGENRERNLDVTCDWCLPVKNAADVREKATVARKRNKHLGIASPKRAVIPGSKASKWKKRLDGSVVPR